MSALPAIFTSPYRAGVDDRKEGLYRPLSVAMFAIEWQLAPGNPRLGHWVNVLFYAATAVVLLLTLARFFEPHNILLPFVATILFVAHPIHTEVVANIKSRDEILCLLFSLIALWAAVTYARRGGIGYLVTAGLSSLLGMLSKETAVTMLIVAPITVYFFQSPTSIRNILMTSVPFFLASVTYLSMRVSALKGVSNLEPIHVINNSIVAAGHDSTARLATAVSILGHYMWLLVFPHPLSFDYSYNTIPLVSFSDPAVQVSLGVILVLAFVAMRGFTSKSILAWSLVFAGTTVALVSNVFFLIEATLAERFLYMPSVGFCVALSFLAIRIFNVNLKATPYSGVTAFAKSNTLILSVVALLVVVYGYKTVSRSALWRNNLTLTANDVETHPNSVRIQHAYGNLLVTEYGMKEKDASRRRHYLEEGVQHLARAVELLPDYADAWFVLGLAYKELGEYKQAIVSLERARRDRVKEDAQYYVALGMAYGEDEQYEKAFELLNEAIQLDSTSSQAYNNIGVFYSRVGRNAMSVQMLDRAMRLSPADDGPPFNMGNTYTAMGDLKTAIEYYEKAITLNQASERAWLNLGNSYGMLRDYPKAIKAFEKVLEINPSNTDARHNIGVTYSAMGDTANANRYLPRRQ